MAEDDEQKHDTADDDDVLDKSEMPSEPADLPYDEEERREYFADGDEGATIIPRDHPLVKRVEERLMRRRPKR